MSRRLSVSLGDDDDRLLSRFSHQGSAEQRALQAWAERHDLEHHLATGSGKTASVLRLLVRAGVEALEEDVLDTGYAQLAAELGSEHEAETKAARHRHLRRVEAAGEQ